MAGTVFQRLTVSEPFLRLGSILAEGPFYRPDDDTLHFIDIKGKLIHRIPLSGTAPPKSLSVQDMIGVACLVEGDAQHYLVAAKNGFGLVDQETGSLTYLAKVFVSEDDEKRFILPFASANLLLDSGSMTAPLIAWEDFGRDLCSSTMANLRSSLIQALDLVIKDPILKVDTLSHQVNSKGCYFATIQIFRYIRWLRIL